MKSSLSLILFSLISSISFSQNPFTISTQDSEKSFSVNCPCYKVLVIDGKVETVNKTTEDWLEDYSKQKVEEKEGYFTINSVRFESFNEDSMFVTYNVVPESNGASVVLNFSTAKGSISSADQISDLNLKTELEKLANANYLEVLKTKLNAEENTLGDFEKKLKKTQKDLEDANNNIVEGKVNIEEIQQKISVLDDNEALITERIGKQNSLIVSSEGEAKKLAEKGLKDIEKERDDLFKEKEKLHKDVIDAEAKIRENEFQKEENQSNIENYKTKILEQKQVVTKLENLVNLTKEKF